MSVHLSYSSIFLHISSSTGAVAPATQCSKTTSILRIFARSADGCKQFCSDLAPQASRAERRAPAR
ncbi:MAG: hypothetical protein ABIH03_00835, partial [Pseudomonadota bacterium]